MINSSQENLALRYRIPEFVYESFNFYRNADGVKAEYVYRLGEYTFHPSNTSEIPLSITPTIGYEDTSAGAVTSTSKPMPSEATKEERAGAAVTLLTNG